MPHHVRPTQSLSRGVSYTRGARGYLAGRRICISSCGALCRSSPPLEFQLRESSDVSARPRDSSHFSSSPSSILRSITAIFARLLFMHSHIGLTAARVTSPYLLPLGLSFHFYLQLAATGLLILPFFLHGYPKHFTPLLNNNVFS